LPKPYLNCLALRATARFLFAAFRSAMEATRSADGGG
jgi:hypothetical protein